MKKIIKFGLVSLISATLGLAACNVLPKKEKLEIEFNLRPGQMFDTDSVEVKLGKWKTYDGDTEIAYSFDSSTNTWRKAELEYHQRTKHSLPIVSYKSPPCEIPYDNIPGSPKGASYIVIDYDTGEEYASGVFGGQKSSEFQEETLKDAKEWAEKIKKYFRDIR